LRRQFYQEAEKFWFVNGPILESTTPFKKGCFLKDLIEKGFLSEIFENFIYDVSTLSKRKFFIFAPRESHKKNISGRMWLLRQVQVAGRLSVFLFLFITIFSNSNLEKKLHLGFVQFSCIP
jgi:hypothetical protein